MFQSDHTPLAEDSALGQWGKFFIEGGKKMGQTFTVLEDGLQRKAMEAAGFVDIQEFDFKVREAPLSLFQEKRIARWERV